MLHSALHRWVFSLLLIAAPFLMFAQGTTAYFLDIPGIRGNADERGFTDQICITSYSWQVQNSGNPQVGGGGGAGTPSFSDFLFGKNLDRSTPELYYVIANGTIYPTMTFTVTDLDGAGQRVTKATYVFEDVLINGLQPGANESGVQAEVLSIIAGKMTLTHYDQNGIPTTRYWNFATNTGG